jgi:hypothetical protein
MKFEIHFEFRGSLIQISGFGFLGCYKSTPLKRNLVLEIWLRRVMGIALLQLHIFTLQLFVEMELQQNLALRSIWLLMANADSGYSKIILRLLGFA